LPRRFAQLKEKFGMAEDKKTRSPSGERPTMNPDIALDPRHPRHIFNDVQRHYGKQEHTGPLVKMRVAYGRVCEGPGSGEKVYHGYNHVTGETIYIVRPDTRYFEGEFIELQQSEADRLEKEGFVKKPDEWTPRPTAKGPDDPNVVRPMEHQDTIGPNMRTQAR
jgi:hypothetical protein